MMFSCLQDPASQEGGMCTIGEHCSLGLPIAPQQGEKEAPKGRPVILGPPGWAARPDSQGQVDRGGIHESSG